ncbi:hypothetical protein PEX1_042360 [Penicillium expansum]|uniref:Uncharacterized protein n=1 Tax=Penicillium expansum TaxID=27334 RepID=A0A0A2IK65_PENEN|nr:hypothetical protein PEX2_002980 [Penicillium expansum]KGO42823.1 hypothetical protein PEXP_025720 [Penicillium expansum]KGO56944.1 hypothetical protein PEX2_002980 [Penicillium expansum]KGO64387.1 hypothetical protein PEX1_042360 [Penicillium expansum]
MAPNRDAVRIPWWFHHESWTTPWSSTSGDFPPEETEREHEQRVRQLKIQPWFKRASCEATGLLTYELPLRWPWGYTIYRTVYTPESDLYWEAAADAIRSNIFATLDWELHHGRRQHEQSHRILRDGYRSLVFDDETRFDGASIAQVREDFRAFVESEVGALGNRFRWCLVIDEEALKCFIRHQKSLAGQSEQDSTQESEPWVTVVEPKYEQEQSSQYAGYMRIPLSRLFRLARLGDMVPMSQMCTISEDIPWYEDF